MARKKRIIPPLKKGGFYELFKLAVNKDKKLKDPTKKEFDKEIFDDKLKNN